MTLGNKLTACVAGAAALAFSAGAFAQGDNVPQDKRWYIAPMLSYGFMDHDGFNIGVPGVPGSKKIVNPFNGDASDALCQSRYGEGAESVPLDDGLSLGCLIEEPGTPGTRQGVDVKNKDSFGVSLAIGKPITSWLNLEAYGFYFHPKQTFSFDSGETYAGHADVWGIGADALIFPVRDVVPVFGILGASWGKMNAKHFNGTPAGDIGGRASTRNLDVGVGYLHNLNEYGLKLRAEYRHRYTSVDARDWFGSDVSPHHGHFNSNILSVGLQIPLGAPPAAPEPAPQPTPTPEPVTQTVTLSTEALFAFDQGGLDGLQPAGRHDLDALVGKLDSGYASIQNIRVEGHTDRLGPADYNQQLSEQRANTVATYLQNHGVDAPMTAVGKGESEPVTSDCVGDVATNKLIACLQPDRRVEVDITGVSQ